MRNQLLHVLTLFMGFLDDIMGALRTTCLPLSLALLSCVSQTPAAKPARATTPEFGMSHHIVTFAAAVSRVLNDRSAKPAPSNTYSYETAYGPDELAEPPVYLVPTETYSGLASTDCSGWVSFVVNTVSPLHQAVLQSQGRLPVYNQVYSDGFALEEGQRPWSRAFVLTNFFRAEYAKSSGLAPVLRFEELRSGDIGAYAMGRYVDPSDAKPGGVGIGTLWFALDGDGRVLRRRIGPGETYDDVVVGAARLQNVILLEPEILDERGDLLVKIFDNSPSEFDGSSVGPAPIDLTGAGGIRLADGRLRLNGRSDFSGGVTVDSGELVAESDSALGTGDVDVRRGALTLRSAALGDTANLQLSDVLEVGAVRLDFSGTDIVGTLQSGDSVHRRKTWGAVGSGAMFTDAVCSGSGVLQLAAEPIEGCSREN